jgi:SWI/SNF-related matrix-associated actin-dependent regulator of chromatin subfamily B protein 1
MLHLTILRGIFSFTCRNWVNGPTDNTQLPPAWLTLVLDTVLLHYPNNRAVIVMQHSAVNKETGLVTQSIPTDQLLPDHIKFMYLPQIICLDCPDKLYATGPGTTIDNFEIHLENGLHTEDAGVRMARSRLSGGPSNTTPEAPSNTAPSF